MSEELAMRTLAYLIAHYKEHEETIINSEEIQAIEFLQQENQKLKSVIKEIRGYIQKNKLYTYKYDEEELFEITTDEVAKTDLLQILDKGDKE